MAKFFDYNPEQAYLLPPSVCDVLGSGHLCFFVRRVMAKLNLSALRNEYGGRPGLCTGDVGFGLAVRLRAGGDQFAKIGTAHSRGFGISLFGGRGRAGSLDTEGVPATARQGTE